jgi:hypothetical protein
MSRSNTLTEIWNTYNKSVLSENVPGVKAAKMGTKAGKPPVDLNNVKHGFANDNSSGPENADKGKIYGNVFDPKHNNVEDELYNSEIYSSEKYTKKDKKLEKKVKESINNNMKSTFDKLFENVMSEEMHSDQETQELDALGIDTEVSETDDEGKVTLTLDRDMVQQLCDVLKEALGEDEDDDSDEAEDMEHEDYEMEEDGFNSFDESEEDGEDHDDEDEDTHKEAVDAEELGHALVNQKDSGLGNPGNNKVGKLKPKGGKSSSSTKKYVDAEPKPLADGKGKLQSKANKVALQAGADFIS